MPSTKLSRRRRQKGRPIVCRPSPPETCPPGQIDILGTPWGYIDGIKWRAQIKLTLQPETLIKQCAFQGTTDIGTIDFPLLADSNTIITLTLTGGQPDDQPAVKVFMRLSKDCEYTVTWIYPLQGP